MERATMTQKRKRYGGSACHAGGPVFEPMEPRLLLDAADVVINEIMYHPAGLPEPLGLEYVELLNTGPDPVNLNGWRLNRGVDYTFGDVTIEGGGYLVAAADTDDFMAEYTEFTGNLVGGPDGWDGRLSNSGEDLELEDATGQRIDLVSYSDEGDWAVRIEGPLDHDHTGWVWADDHDGGGKSLELLNPALSNEYGQNWAASLADGGTPGEANSGAADNLAPMILDLQHYPLIPSTFDNVTITCRVLDELTTGLTVRLHTRVDDVETEFTAHEMFDDGQHGDGAPGDGLYGAVLDPQPANLTIIEFYVEALDAGGRARTWPGPVPGHGQVANALFQVDNSHDPYADWVPGSMPIYHLIMTDAERDELINGICGGGDDRWSDAQMNGTFISVDGVDTRVRYQVGIRNRGAGSRGSSPYNHRVNFPHDTPWKGVAALNINHRYSWLQVIGSTMWRAAGLPDASAKAVEVRVNGVDRAQSGDRMYGAYAALEALDSDWVERWIPDDSAGDLWRCTDKDGQSAELNWISTDPDDYRRAYKKQTNASQDEWDDLITMMFHLEFAPTETFIETISPYVNIDQWLRYLAVDTLIGNREGGLTNGQGDDYALYQGVLDPRFMLVPHDLDTILGQGDHSPDLERSIFSYDGVDGLDNFLHHPDVVPRYYAQFLDLIDTVFAPENFNPMIDEILGGWVPAGVIQDMKDFAGDRIHSAGAILDQIPMPGLSIASPLPVQDGYPYTTSESWTLSGTADGTTRSVSVNGALADWDPRPDGTWTFDSTDFDDGYEEQTLVTADAEISYHVPTDGQDPLAWTGLGYDDDSWTDSIAEGLAGLLVTEISTGDLRYVELQNVSAGDIDTSGWVVAANDPSAGTSGLVTTLWDLPAPAAADDVLYRTDEAGDAYWGETIPWDPEGPGWVMIVDDAGNLMDFVAWGYTEAEIAALSVDVNGFPVTVGSQWTGDGADVGTTEPGDPTGGFVAFNDHVSGPATHANATTYRANGTASGYLKNIATGDDTTVTLATSQVGVAWAGGSSNPAGGTDAHEVFNGYVDFSSGTNASMELVGGDTCTHTFTGLDTGDVITYNVTGTSIRGGGYPDRWTLVTLQDADGATPAHSAGLGIVVINDNEVALWCGENDWPDQGFVVGWDAIDPGPDGDFSIVSSQYTGAIPVQVDPGGVADGSKGYGLTGIRLEEVAPAGPLSFLKRTGSTDSGGAGDFVRDASGSQGAENSEMTVPFGTVYPTTMGVGYSDGPYDAYVATDAAADMQGAAASLWTRVEFAAPDLPSYDGLTLRIRYDDGFVAYLNGAKVAERNAPGSPAWDSAATGEHAGTDLEEIDISANLGDLLVGDNVLAIHGLNVGAADADFLIQAELIAARGIPGLSLDLAPGINRITVATYDGPDGTGNVLDSDTIDIWYDTGSTTNYPQVAPGVGAAVSPGQADDDGQPATVGEGATLDVNLLTRDSYLPGVPFLVRVKVIDQADGSVYRDLWDATATIQSLNPAVLLDTSAATLYNGLGSALVTATGSGDFNLQVDVGGMQTSTTLVDSSGRPVNTVSGGIGDDVTWSGVVHVTGGDFAIADGVTLTIEAGTLVLIDGVASGTDGTDIDVAGAIQSLGTADAPVTFTAYAAGENWGELDFRDAEPSTFQYTNIHQAGHSPAVGHSNSGPAIRATGSTFIFDHANLTDNAGKIMQATSGTDLVFRDSLFARSIMGPEIAGTALLFENSWITDMHADDDADGIYIHDQQAGQTCTLIGGVATNIDDDGIDTLGSEITVRDFIVRDCKDKGISVYGGETTVDRCLIVENNKAPEDPTVATIAAKTTDGSLAVVNIDHSTIVTTTTDGVVDFAVQSHNKYGVTSGTIIWNVTNSIIVATDPINVQAPYLESDIHVDYTDVFDETWPGTGNLQLDPMFANPAAHDYRLQPGSPCIDAGDPNDPPDPDDTRTDMGYFAGATAAADVTVTIEATDSEAAEQNADTGTFTITRTGETTDPLTVHYSVGGTAGAGDYTPALSGDVVILAGDATVAVTITPVDDPDYEPDETVTLTLTSDPAYAVGSPASAIVMIADDDQTSGSLTENTLWTAAEGPYLVTAELTVPAGISLTIAEGTTVFFAPGAQLTVRGLLQADGAEYAPVRFTRLPGSGATWGGIQFDGTMQDNRITYAVLEYGRTNNGMIGLTNSNLLVDHATFDHTDYRRIRTEGSALVVRNSIFTDLFGPGEAPTWDNHNEHIWGTAGAGLAFLIENNRFGTTKGHSDAIDVNGAAGMRLQILNNTFLGGGDDALDLEGDAYIEGNVFMHFHKDQWNTGAGNANAISAGAGKQYVMVRNVFSDLDHAAQVKNDAFLTFVNNTVYDLDYSAIYFLRPGEPSSYGDGAYVDGSIFRDVPLAFDNVTGDVDLTVHRSIVDVAWHGYGTGNLDTDPRLADPSGGDFSLLAGSAALGAGAMGLDMGYDVPAGVVVRTDVPAVTYLTDATFNVGGPGIDAYQYQLDGGGWSAEQTVEAPIVLAGLGDAQDHTLEVIGRTSAGVWQNTADAASNVWHVDTAHRRLLINEVLADNESAVEAAGLYPDVIELYYDAPAGAADLDLEGYSLSDGPNTFTFGAGAVIPAGGYLVLYGAADPGGAGGTWLDFGLQAEGDDLRLVEPDGWTVVDSVAFGPQVPDRSIGRTGPARAWTLAQPTAGAANVAAPTGRQDTLVLNEWFANGGVAFVDDFVELHNPDTLPVALEGLYLTDNPISQKAKAALGPLGFVAAQGYAAFRADDSSAGGHVAFRLTADEGMLALYGADGTQVDRILYLPQTTDTSQGRVPDGGDVRDFFPIPTPGVANPKVLAGETVIETLVTAGAGAVFHVPTDGEDALAWTAPGYDDSLWTSEVPVDGAGLVVTEIETGENDWVEIQNVSGQDISTAGWTVVVNDPSGGSINDVLPAAWDLPASVAADEVLYRTDEAGDDYWGEDIPWDAGGAGWAMILDSGGNVADFLVWGYTEGEIDSFSIDYGGFVGITVGGQWSGDGAEVGDGSGTGVPGPQENVFDFGATWDYLHPLDATDPAASDPDFNTTWMQSTGYDGPAFDSSGPGILGYGTINYSPGVATDIGRPADGDRYTAYFRREVTLAGNMVNVGLEILSDDGAVIYIDGVEVARNNFTGDDTYFAFANGYTYPNGDNTENVTRTLTVGDLGAGTHTMAVSMHQNQAGSSDLGFGLRLFGQPDGGLGSALERSGNADANTAADFAATATPTPGAQNAGMVVPFGATAPVVTGLGFSGGHFDDHVQTDVADAMLGTNASLWTRIDFQAPDPSTYNILTLRVQYDDGFVAYLNGVKIAERNAPASPAWDSAATGEHPDGQAVLFERIDVSGHLGDLLVGDNVLAIHGLNLAPGDADFLISAELEAASSAFDPNLLGLLGGLRVSEIMYHHPVGSELDFLELVNAGDESIDLTGVRIDGGVAYTFTGGTLAAGESIVVADDPVAFEAWYGSGINVAGRYTGSLSNGGEELILRLHEPYDAAVLRFEYSDSWFGTKTDGDGLSLVIIDASRPRRTWDDRWSWQTSGDIDPASIVINEVLAHQDDPLGDWIEITNHYDEPVDLAGWFLSDDAADLMKYEITAAAVGDTILDPGQYMVFTEAQHFGEFATDPGNHTWFALSEHGDDVWLSSGSGGVLGTYRQTVGFGASDNGVSLGRHITSIGEEHFVAMSGRTMGAGNADPKVGPVVINELMYHPVDGQDEFIELYNVSAADVPLYDPANTANTWQFTGGVTFAFPTGVTLAAGEYLLVTQMDPAAFRAEFGIDPSVRIYGPFEDSTALANDGETVEVSKPGTPEAPSPEYPEGFVPYIVVDRVDYSDGREAGDPWPNEPDGSGPSIERLVAGHYGDDVANWCQSQQNGGTPGQRNSPVPPEQDWLGGEDNHWNNPANWSAAVVPDLQTMARFDGNGTYEPALYQDQQVKGMAFETAGWTLEGNGYTLTVGRGDLASTGVGANVVGPNVALSADSTWTVGTDNTLEVTGTLSGGSALTKDGAGTLTVGGAQDLAALLINAGTVRLASGGANAIVTDALHIDSAAVLDLAEGNLIVQYEGGPSPYDAVAAWVASGYNGVGGGYWDGFGITSSSAAGHSQRLTALGVIDNSDPDPKIGDMPDLEGVPVSAESVLVKHTWWGDANLDGVVNSNDYDMIDTAWLLWTNEGRLPEGGFRWAVGDFNYDGLINSNDYDKIDNSWTLQGGPMGGAEPAPAAVDALPEAGVAAWAAAELSTAAPQDAPAGENEALPSLNSETVADPVLAGGRAGPFGPDSVTALRVVSDTKTCVAPAPPPMQAVAAAADTVLAADGGLDLLAAPALEIPLGHSLA